MHSAAVQNVLCPFLSVMCGFTWNFEFRIKKLKGLKRAIIPLCDKFLKLSHFH